MALNLPIAAIGLSRRSRPSCILAPLRGEFAAHLLHLALLNSCRNRAVSGAGFVRGLTVQTLTGPVVQLLRDTDQVVTDQPTEVGPLGTKLSEQSVGVLVGSRQRHYLSSVAALYHRVSLQVAEAAAAIDNSPPTIVLHRLWNVSPPVSSRFESALEPQVQLQVTPIVGAQPGDTTVDCIGAALLLRRNLRPTVHARRLIGRATSACQRPVNNV